MSEIKNAPLSDLVVEIIDNRGRTCPTGEQGMPLIATNCIKEDSIYPTHEKVRYVSEETYKEWFRGHPLPGDILFVNKGTPGRVCLAPDPIDFCIAQDMVALRANQSVVSPLYLFAALRSPQAKACIENMHVGTMIPHFKKGDFDKLLIPLPSRGDQERIGDLYYDFSLAIENKRKTNETLEAMAKALFKSWFVDFDPVRAKAEGRPTGLPAEISDLFPDSFEDSELGEIPRGWRDGEIQDVAELNPETWGSRNQPLSVRYLDLSNLKHGKIDSVEEYQWEDAPSRARRILKTGDTVIGTVRPGNGSYCLIGEDGITGSTGFAVLRPKNKNDSAFVYLGSCSKENIDRLAHLADGGAYPAVRPELVAQTPVIIAARDLLDCFSRSVSPLFAAAEERKQSSKLLCQVRDALLPKLISGEIRIPDAEKMLEEVGL
jgi:type I restriction enzyme S subunit